MILNDLNDEQKLAVNKDSIDGPMLILAGAGSGKTKTITTRIAYLISLGINPGSILTLTFTNKAANEMRMRALNLLDKSRLSTMPLLCTFHKFGLLFLKMYIGELGRKNNFIIIDTDDKKRILKSFDCDIAVSILAAEISKMKNMLIKPADALSAAKNDENDHYKKIAKIYEQYQERLLKENLVDFDDLLCLPYEILENNDDLCKSISQTYQYIMVDEYQDTNDIQFKLLKKLCRTHSNICVVGDDDQSIYGWRGAKIENILNFKNEFENVKLIKLEKNYRSTEHILNAANELINHNRNRLGKNLIGTKGKGEEIEIYESEDTNYEANKISNHITKLVNSGVNPNEIAILYRVNALSRSIEDGLTRAGIQYKMVGGVKFYERAEIKDIIAYLRLILSNNDDFSLRRIINRPKRGLGEVGLAKIEKMAFEAKTTLFEAILNLNESVVSKKVFVQLNEFAKNIVELSKESDMSVILDKFEEAFKLKNHYASMADGDDRVANIDEFMAMLKENIKDENFDLSEFLNDLSLQSEQDAISNNAVSVMSIHASKGLEFDYIFVIGLEEGFFPLVGDSSDIEEERRIAYVAITRAKKHLILSTCETRYLRGRKERLSKSRFLGEAGLIEAPLEFKKTDDIKKGDLVNHKIFGIGRVLGVTVVKNDSKLKINFGGITREIMASFVEKVV